MNGRRAWLAAAALTVAGIAVAAAFWCLRPLPPATGPTPAPPGEASSLSAPTIATPRRSGYSAATKERLLAALPRPMFVEAARALGIDLVHQPDVKLQELRRRLEVPMGLEGGGVAAGDYDGDGWTDLYFAGGGGGRLYRNLAGERFDDVTSSAGLRLEGESRAGYFIDHDNDGDLDLFITFAWALNRLLENDGGGRFADITGASGLDKHADVTHEAVWFDMDGDGLLDVYTANFGDWPLGEGPVMGKQNFNGGPNRLYRQRRAGTRSVFDEIGAQARVDDRGWTHCVAAWDVDEDGREDLVSINDFARSHVYRNAGGNRFTECSLELGLKETYNAMSIDLFDADGDGRVEAYVGEKSTLVRDPGTGGLRRILKTEGSGPILSDAWRSELAKTVNNRLYVRNAAGGLDERHAELFEPAELGWAWASSPIDYENDGDVDLLVLNGTEDRTPRLPGETRRLHQANARFLELYASDRNHFFVAEDGFRYDVYDACPIAYRGNSRGAAFLDFDGDGDLDVAVSDYAAPAKLFRNEAPPGNHWLRLSLEGRRSNRSAIGARVRVTDSAGRVHGAVVVSRGGFLSQSPQTLHFGLGAALRAARVEVRWPSGAEARAFDLEANRQHRILEPR